MRDHMICIGHKLNINMLLLGYREVEQRRKPYELWAIIVMACLCAIEMCVLLDIDITNH